MIEQMLRWYSTLHDFRAVVMRYFNVFGTSDDARYGYAKKPVTHLVDAAVQGALGLHSFALTCGSLFDTADGTPVRDYLHVVDLNEAHFAALEMTQQSKIPLYEVINLGSGSGDTVLQIVEKVEKGLHVSLPRSISEVRAGEDARLVADITKAKHLLSWQPQRTIEASLPAMVTWYTAHPTGWEK